MGARTTLRWIALALAGLVIAAGASVAASRLAGQRIGLASEPITAGEELAPRQNRPASTPRRRPAEDHPATSPQRPASTPRRQPVEDHPATSPQRTVHQTVPAPTAAPPSSGDDERGGAEPDSDD